MTPIYGSCVGGVGIERTYILVDEDGNEYPATLVDNETILDATPNDIRIGKFAATAQGVIEGEKVIPACHTTEGIAVVEAENRLKLLGMPHYDYTKLQVLVCEFNTSLSDSVATNYACIEGNTYPVSSTTAVGQVTMISEDQAIDLGITNDSEKPLIIRYFMYKEIY